MPSLARNFAGDFNGWLTHLPRFQGARPDHVRVESSRCCCPRASLTFDQWHVTRSPSIKNVFELGGVTTCFDANLTAFSFKCKLVGIRTFDFHSKSSEVDLIQRKVTTTLDAIQRPVARFSISLQTFRACKAIFS